eukprot:SAG22_NODE_33_length_27588_cov_104.174652_6_plen_536_part_00
MAVQVAAVDPVEFEDFLCTDLMDGTYSCVFPEAWCTTSSEFEFVMKASDEEFSFIRNLVDPSTGLESTAETYSSGLVVLVEPVLCQQDHSFANSAGSACVCETGYYQSGEQLDASSSWSCERCNPGEEPSASGKSCQLCAFGTYSGNGQECSVCAEGYEPNQQTGAISCSFCDEKYFSPDGVKCRRCSADQVANALRTHCICPVYKFYNTSLRGGNLVRCIAQSIQGRDRLSVASPTICAPCADLVCIECRKDGLSVREEYAVAQIEYPWLVFKCPFEGACVQDADSGERCKDGHTGLLCAECQPGYGLDRDECIECSSTNSSPFALGMIIGSLCVLVGLVLLWKRWGKRQEVPPPRPTNIFFEELSEQLTANPLQREQAAPFDGRRSFNSIGSSRRELALTTAQKTTDLYLLFRVVYQPVRIIVGYIQVVTQIGPVLDLEFPKNIQAVLNALKPFMIDLQSILQLDCLSGGLWDYYATWCVRVFLIPAVMLLGCSLQYCYERRQVGASTAAGYFRANAFVVVFLCYPGVCNQVR